MKKGWVSSNIVLLGISLLIVTMGVSGAIVAHHVGNSINAMINAGLAGMGATLLLVTFGLVFWGEGE